VLILLVGVFLPFSIEVSATTPSSLHELLLNKQVFTRGETFNVTVLANVDTVQVSVFSPERLFLSYNQAANTSATFLVGDEWSFGFWNVTANFGGTQTGSFFTVLNNGDYANASLPYTNVHLGTNYTITDAGVNVTLLSTNRTLVLIYPTIASLNQTATVEYNNMSVRSTVFSGQDPYVLTYAFVHSGVKLIVNGSTEISNNFEFSVNSSGSQRDNSFRSGNIVFDWSDVIPSGLSTSWSDETKTLSVDVDSSFTIDAFIYTVGFESGDFGSGGWGWYGYEPSIVSSPNSTVWKGNYSCLTNNQGDSGLIKYVYGDDPAAVNLRAYFFISTLPSINQSASLAWITGMYDMGNGSSISYGVAAVLAYSDENHSKIGLSQPWNSFESPVFNESPTLISADSWFCLEIGINSTGGYLWINSALDVMNTAYSSQGLLNEGAFFVGTAYRTGGYLSDSTFIDEVAYSDPYIGEAFAEFSNLGISLYDFGGITSSFSVVGTVHLYSSLYYQSYEITFTDTTVDLTDYWMIWLISSWNDHVFSLEVQGTVTLFEHTGCQGKSITLTNKAIPTVTDDNLGTMWNTNPELIKSQGGWDCKSHDWVAPLEWLPWTMISSDCIEDPPSSSNKMNWASDGCATGHSSDDLSQWWKCCDLAQGYERNAQGPKDLSLYPTNWPSNWNDVTCSLKVTGSVTLYDAANWQGQLGNPYSSDVPNLGGYCNRVSSLSVSGRVTLYDQPNYQGHSIIFDCSCSNPLEPLPVSSQSSINLEAVVSDANDNLQSQTLSGSWTGAKFDVWVVENKDSGPQFMLELYFIRGGGNLHWEFRGGDLNTGFTTVNHGGGMLMAVDAFPEYASRTVYSNEYVKWTLDIKGIVQYACSHNANMHFGSLKIAKIAFTLESASNGYTPFPSISCDCHRLRLCYAPFSAGVSVGCSSSQLYSMASAASQSFVAYYNTLGLGQFTGTLSKTQDTAANVYQGVSNGRFAVGLVDRLPTVAEWQSNSALQLWIIGYNGPVNLYYPQYPYDASKVIWAVTNRVPSSVTVQNAMSVFIDYLRLPNHYNPSYMGDYKDIPGASFPAEAGYNLTSRADFIGAPTVDANLNPYTTGPSQTQSIPDGVVGVSDFFYFAAAYTQYNTNHQLNPYADMNADGKVTISDFFIFAGNYYINIYWARRSGSRESGGLDVDLSSSGVVTAVQAGSNDTVVWSVGPDPDPINSTIQVDIRIDNASNIWGWAVSNVTWNSSVLELSRISEGDYLCDSHDALFLRGTTNNTLGQLMGGVGDAIIDGNSNYAEQTSGVLCTLTFKVVGYGVSDVNLSGVLLQPPPDSGLECVTLDDVYATITVNQPTP
jgi:hypothetical protein